jgi:hypothetical protein
MRNDRDVAKFHPDTLLQMSSGRAYAPAPQGGHLT